MPIDFPKSRWQDIKGNSDLWWQGKLKRPLIDIRLSGKDPGRPKHKAPYQHQTSAYGPEISADDIIDVWDYNLSAVEYLGDAIPSLWPNFGPGVIAAFLGAAMETNVKTNTVWFHPKEKMDISKRKFLFDNNNPVFKRLCDIYRAGIKRWEGNVLMGLTDLGGNLDILSSFRPSEQLLLDLYDNPDQVKRLTWEAHEMWHTYFNEFNKILQPVNHGYSAWTLMHSSQPYYMLQCDFAYMISPEMFDEFVKPELAATCKKLTNPFYHLDGKGQLAHLDSLLSIPELKGIQWVPGDGAPHFTQWPEVYKKIRNAGKLIQIWIDGSLGALEKIAAQVGSAEGIYALGWDNVSNEKEIRRVVKKFGA